uniref:Multifunctional fusion protein n=1 Tax=Bos indicus x Bos taurus TaxID=30522 RepID=A0A4W2EW75_BOBOX
RLTGRSYSQWRFEGVSSKERFLHIELRCLCVKTISGIPSSNIQSLEVNRAGPHCNKVEVIAELKNGKKICLNPEGPRIKKIVQKILEDEPNSAEVSVSAPRFPTLHPKLPKKRADGGDKTGLERVGNHESAELQPCSPCAGSRLRLALLSAMNQAVVPRASRPRSSPGLLLLGLLLLPAIALAQESSFPATFVPLPADSEGGESEDLQCVCLKTTSGINPRHISSLEVIGAGLHCPSPQLIATLKTGRKICLDQQNPLYKKIIKRLLKS